MEMIPLVIYQYQLCHLSILVEKISNRFSSFSILEAYFPHLHCITSLDKFLHHGPEMILIPPEWGPSMEASL